MEVKDRELDSKVLLSCMGAERGFGVLLGRSGFNSGGGFPKGVYLDKCISPHKAEFLRMQVNKLGNKVASLDEEGLVYRKRSDYLSSRTSRETVDLSSIIFTWGDAQLEMINDYYNIPEKLVATGSPRADLWERPLCGIYKEKADKILSQYGDFILVPANFAPTQHTDPIQFAISHSKRRENKENTSVSHDRYGLEYCKNMFEKFVELIGAIAERYHDLTVILRPHPNDNLKIWEQVKKDWPENVKVVYQGIVTPWILASKVLVHNNCTTGIEAFAMGKPTIAYMPLIDERLEHKTPNPLSQQSNSVEGILKLIEVNLDFDGLGREEEKNKLLDRYIKREKNVLSGDRILTVLESLDLPEASFSTRGYGMFRKIQVAARKINRRFNDFTGKNEFSYAYRKRKNPGVNMKEIVDIVGNIQNSLKRWDDILIEQVGEDLFCFFRN